jgi:hypothetical protein
VAHENSFALLAGEIFPAGLEATLYGRQDARRHTRDAIAAVM